LQPSHTLLNGSSKMPKSWMKSSSGSRIATGYHNFTSGRPDARYGMATSWRPGSAMKRQYGGRILRRGSRVPSAKHMAVAVGIALPHVSRVPFSPKDTGEAVDSSRNPHLMKEKQHDSTDRIRGRRRGRRRRRPRGAASQVGCPEGVRGSRFCSEESSRTLSGGRAEGGQAGRRAP
jgi:hypothetical protein